MTEPSIKTLGRVILIDDDCVDRMASERLLKRLHLADELHCFPDAETAVHYMESDAASGADVIFLDINMPRMNGLEFVEEISNSRRIQFSGTVAVMVSTDLSPGMQDRFNQFSHVRSFIRKPMTSEALIATAATIAATK